MSLTNMNKTRKQFYNRKYVTVLLFHGIICLLSSVTHKPLLPFFSQQNRRACFFFNNRSPPSTVLLQQQVAAVPCSSSTTGRRRRCLLFSDQPFFFCLHSSLFQFFSNSVQKYQHVFYSCHVILRRRIFHGLCFWFGKIRLSSGPCRHQHQKQHSLCARDGEGSLHHVG